MAGGRGNKSVRKPGEPPESAPEQSEVAEGSPAPEEGAGLSIPELMRRALSVGFTGFFLTEEAIRKALGDTLPKDWSDFAVEQSERTRAEFLERLSFEIGRSLENIDIARVLSSLLEGRTLEVKAQVRLVGEPGSGTPELRIQTRSEPELEDD